MPLQCFDLEENLILMKKWGTAKSFIRKDVTSYKIHTLGKHRFKIMLIMLLFATTCIMLYYMNEIKDPNPNNVLDIIAFTFFFGFSVAMYVFIIGFIIKMVFYFFKKKDQKDFLICLVMLLVFVSLSAAVFTTIKCVRVINYFTTFWQTTLVIDAIVLYVFVIATIIYLTYEEQKSDINTEEKKAAVTKVKKVKPRNYDSMTDTKVLIENI